MDFHRRSKRQIAESWQLAAGENPLLILAEDAIKAAVDDYKKKHAS